MCLGEFEWVILDVFFNVVFLRIYEDCLYVFDVYVWWIMLMGWGVE